jgi:hypothetical protein
MIPELRTQLDRLKANTKALQPDKLGNPDMEVTDLIAQLLTNGSDSIKRRCCDKMDGQAREIALQAQVIVELKAQLRDMQDALYDELTHPLGPNYRPSVPWTSKEEQ